MDTVLFNSLLLAELDALWRFSLHLCRNEHKASNLTQETCAKALIAADTFTAKGGGIRSWLFCICHTTWRNQKRDGRFEKNSNTEDSMDDYEDHSFEMPVLEISTLNWDQVDERLKNAIEQLPETHRMPLLLWAIEDMPYHEIANILDIPLGTVMSRLSHSRTLLITLLAELATKQGAE